jgi:uncharacterized protein YdhG (YjbR/CyaY superfamily)
MGPGPTQSTVIIDEWELNMEAKMKPTSTIDEHIAQFPIATQKKLLEIRELIRSLAPGATEAISYGIPTFKLNGNLVHFAGYINHIGFYPGSEAIEVFKKELAGYKTSKGTIQFPLDTPIPIDLIRRITEFRIQKNLAKPKR